MSSSNWGSLNVRLPHVLDWCTANQPDVLCLQETKQEDSKFPYEALTAIGYNAIHSGQKTYNGVAILSRHVLEQPSSRAATGHVGDRGCGRMRVGAAGPRSYFMKPILV